MSRQQTRPPAAAQIPSSARQNEYFVPRDGIDREVITSDICRYLGNDALVRPGTYESSDGRVTQGYFITAYRNLTSAMIQDLKADSARWEQERRAASRTGGGAGGTAHSSQQNGILRRGSNSPVGSRGEPRGQVDYLSWKNRQLDNRDYGVPPADRMDVEYSSPPSVVQPGYGVAPPYGAPAPGYPPAPYPAPVHGGGAAYGQPYGYPANPPATQYSPGPQPTADRYPPPIASAYPSQETFVHGSNYSSAAPGYPAPVVPSRMTPMSMTSAPPARGYSTTTSAPYPDTDAFGGYGAPPANPVSSLQFQNLSNPGDPVYGRAPGGSPAGTAPPRQSYSAAPEPPYDEHQSPALPNAPTPTNGSQIPPPGQPPARRDVDPRDRDRDRDSRGHRPHRSETDREDRHAAERARHRQHR